MARELAPQLPVQGNLDPLLPVLGGKPLSRGVEHLVRAMPADRHIFNLGHGMMPATPPEHVAAMLRHIRALDGTAT
jgi:uroporphyrinogen decarboxylase